MYKFIYNKFDEPIDFNELKQFLEKEHQIIYNMYKIIHTNFYIKLAKNDDSNIEVSNEEAYDSEVDVGEDDV